MSPWPSQSSAQSPQLWAGPAVRPAGQPDSCDPLSNLHATLSATPPGRPKTVGVLVNLKKSSQNACTVALPHFGKCNTPTVFATFVFQM